MVKKRTVRRKTKTEGKTIISEEVMDVKNIVENITSLDDLPKVPEREDRPEISVSHRYSQDPMKVENYIEMDKKYGYYWHDTMLIERQGWGIWSPVTSDNHVIPKKTRQHVDGTIRLGGTAILCYAPKGDVKAEKDYFDNKTDDQIKNQAKSFHDEISQLRRGHPGCEGSYGTIRTGRY